MVGNRDAQLETQSGETDNTNNRHNTMTCSMRMEKIDEDNGEVSMRKMVATARWNLLEDNKQVDLMILDDLDEARSPLRTGPWWLKRSVGPGGSYHVVK
jgi:hypothetical protein